MTANDADPGGSAQEGDRHQALPPERFFDALRASFRRLRPQGSDHWNFADAFQRLEVSVGEAETDEESEEHWASPGKLRQVADRVILERLEPMVEQAARRASREHLGSVHASLSATRDALRFLAARVEALEEMAGRRSDPVDGLAWLLEPPAIGHWGEPVARYLGDAGSGEGAEILHSGCGDGALASTIADSGFAVAGAEPRGSVAWQAAERGFTIRVGSTEEALTSRPRGSLGGLVLSGVVDRSSVDRILGLISLAAERLSPGAPLVVISERPEAWADRWGSPARDLLPGRPLAPETWHLLLGRSAFGEVADLGAAQESATFALATRRA